MKLLIGDGETNHVCEIVEDQVTIMKVHIKVNTLKGEMFY